MLRLGNTTFWLDATASGWMLLHVTGEKRRVTKRYGPLTSPKHVLQQRAVKLPKSAALALVELVGAVEAGDEMLAGMPEAGI